MSDLIERLLAAIRKWYTEDTSGVYGMGSLLQEAADEIERLRRELAEALSRQSCDNGKPWICHALATARSELAEAQGLLRRGFAFAANCEIDPGQPPEFQAKAKAWREEVGAHLTPSDQPDAVKPCADCGEPTDVWHDGTHLCWKCRA